ncbi:MULTISPECIES: DUF6876 family protein [Cyanophyceae]|uniref:DUF6876 domain-containing protein n=1 Tax=Leptolyngbya subtilissima DQ-A4 TaxID=2933933 RepID=A0ABV0KA88_9CYAN|nr:DUF6876 family protein [Nodosilinea sp. FACHB-141]MBD2115189.1 hypothetical protein [Nodosilinea sp. FACHB-141]
MTADYTEGSLREEDLRQFRCTEQYWKTGMPWHPFVYTDGVRHVVHRGQALWMLTVIGSWQTDPKVKKNKRLQDMQFWTFEKDKHGSGAVMRCERDENDVVVEQTIGYTDFPLSQMRFYLAHMWCHWEARSKKNGDEDLGFLRPSTGVLLLPSEY